MELSKQKTKGFTLIELLVVIAIIAVLSVVIILTLNPAELLKQSRDSNRISDLGTIKSAISLYLADVSSPLIGTSTTCYVHASSGVTSATCQGRSATTTVSSSISSVGVNGTGWIPVNFASISSGAPVSAEPRDPVSNTTYFYSYIPDATNLTFELDSKMESNKYKSGGGSDVEGTDGGNSSTLYEVGTAPGLLL